jgi:hypothetical protein
MVNQKQINCEKDNRDQSDNRGVFDFFSCGPRNALHLCPHITQKLRHATEWPNSGATETTLTTRAFTLNTLAKAGGAGSRKRRVRVFYVIHRLADLFETSSFKAAMAGVPGFEPGLSVLETDVLTVDTIPL